MSGRICAIAGGKGGVGKTTAVANIATALSAADFDVVAVDVDLGMANLGALLDINDEIETSIHDVLAGEAGILEATYSTDLGFSVVPGSQTLDKYASADPSQLEFPVSQLTNVFDVVLLDTGSGLSREVMVPLGFADRVVLVTTPDVVSIRDAAKTGELTGRVGGTVSGVIVNRARENQETESILAELGDEVLATVPEDGEITLSQSIARTGSPTARSFAVIAARLVGTRQLEETEMTYADFESLSGSATESDEVSEAVDTADADELADADDPADADDDTSRSSPGSLSLAGMMAPDDETYERSDSEEADEESTQSEADDSPDGPITTDAYDDAESDETFFDDEVDERSSALGRLRGIFD